MFCVSMPPYVIFILYFVKQYDGIDLFIWKWVEKQRGI